MTKPAVFTQGDVSKLLKGAKAAGMTVTRVEIDPTGKLIAQFGSPEAADKPNPWKAHLDAKKEHAARERHRV